MSWYSFHNFTTEAMDPKISKSQIQTEYNDLIAQGIEDWDARAAIISSIMNNSPNSDPHTRTGSAEYYFTIQTIWNLCEQ
jgi:hypothetical protein